MIEIKDAESFRKSISSISGFIKEGNIRFNDSGIHLRGVDQSQVVLVDFVMAREAFKKFEVEPALVGVDLAELNKILSRVLAGEHLSLDITESELKLVCRNEFEKKFSMPLIEVGAQEVNLPKLKFDASVEITARVLKEILKDASVFGSIVVFSVKKNVFFVQAKGNHGAMEGFSSESKAIKASSLKDTLGKFSLNFLQNIVREANPDEKILLELRNDSPMKVSFRIGSCGFEFFLAHMLL